MGGTLNLNMFGPSTPPALGKLFFKMLADMGALDRLQAMSNTADQMSREYPMMIPIIKSFGIEVALAICYSISPRHTDEHFAEKRGKRGHSSPRLST